MIDSLRVLVNTSKLHRLAAGLLLLTALTIRLANLNVTNPVYDESLTLAVVDNIFHGDLRNNWKFAKVPEQYQIDFYNFSSYFYVDAAFVKLADVAVVGPPAAPLHWHRVFSALSATLAVFLFYLLALKWFDGNTALLTIAFLSVAPILVQDAHYARPEGFELFLVGLLYLLAIQLHEAKFRYSVLAAACACVGFLGAMKFSLLPMLALVLLWVPTNLWKDRVASVRIAITAVGATVLGMFVGVPHAFFHPSAYWNGVRFLRSQYAGVHRPHGNLAEGNTFGMAIVYFWETLGPILLILALVGAIALLRKERKVVLASLCLPIAFYFVVFSIQRTFFERNLSHVVPLVLMLSAAGLCFIVEQASTHALPRWLPPALGWLLILGAVAPPALLTGKLVLVAMPGYADVPRKEYEKNLLRRTGLIIEESTSLLINEEANHLVDLTEGKSRGVLVRVRDYKDQFTAHNLDVLGRHVRIQQIGYFPSVFESLSTSTMHVYHSPAYRYLLLRPQPENQTEIPVVEIEGRKFHRLGGLSREVEPGPIDMNSWVPNGVYPGVELPSARGRYFGSWTEQLRDRNKGTLRMGPMEVPMESTPGLTFGIPMITGPATRNLSVVVKDHQTGAELARLDPPPVLAKWKLWEVDLPKDRTSVVDVIASDQGSDWGQWLAIGVPRTIDEMFSRLGAELPDTSVAIQGSWTRDGYYPTVGRPPVDGTVYGSWSGNDANVGSLHLGPIRMGQTTSIALPLVTGPGNVGLCIKALDTRTKKVIASLNPPPVHTAWWVWNIDLPREPDSRIEIVADDTGTGYGQWMAIAKPHAVR